jgi:DNA-binding CsgD family transcriptional regulator
MIRTCIKVIWSWSGDAAAAKGQIRPMGFGLVFAMCLFSQVTALPLSRGNGSAGIYPYHVSQFDLQHQCWGISQDPQTHRMYFASSKGLLVFNGIAWERHTLGENLPLRSVKVHPKGLIFTGAFEAFGYWQYNEVRELVYHSLAGLTEVSKNDEVWKIYFHDDKVYFQTFTSIYIYDFQTIEKVTAPWTMLFMHQVGDRFLVQILENGLFWFEDGTFSPLRGSEIFSDKQVHAIVPYGEDAWLIATQHDGIFHYGGHGGQGFSYFESEASDFLKEFTCNAARQIDEFTYAFGSILGGLIITDRQGNVQREYQTETGLNNNTVLTMMTDADRGLWVGLDVGVNYINSRSPLTHYRSSHGSLGTIYAILPDGDQIYIGTNHGLFQADIVQRGQTFLFSNLRFIPESNGQVWTLEKADGQIICGHNEGTFQVRDGRIYPISQVTGGWVYAREGDHLIGGTYTGLIVLAKSPAGQWVFRNKVSGFSEPTRYLETDYLGYVWASHHQKGIYQIELEEDLYAVRRVRHFPDLGGRTYNIKTFKINNRVVFSTSEDIYTYDFVRNEISTFDILTGQLGAYKTADQVQHYKDNLYWFITRDRIALFEIEMDFTATKRFELPYAYTFFPQRNIQLAALDENTILIPNPRSFDAYNLRLGASTEEVSRLQFEYALFFNDRDSIILQGRQEKIRIPWKFNNVRVNFSDPSNFDRAERKFDYRIQELGAIWQATHADYLTFMNLKYGTYNLEVRSGTGQIVQMQFTVDKPWYRTNLAIIAYFLALGAGIWGLVLFFRYEIQRQKELAELENRQSTLLNELDYKSFELMMTMRHLMMKDGILSDLQKEIDTTREQSTRFPVKSFNNMEKILSRGLGSSNADWENAMQNLKLSQQGFYKFLKEKYPELTPNDLRMCAYLRMNFNTKEIAQLLNISARSVETSRHRLRKKLKLGKKQNLTEFLISLDWEEVTF